MINLEQKYNAIATSLGTLILAIFAIALPSQGHAQPLSPSIGVTIRSSNWHTQSVNQASDSSVALGRMGAWGSVGHGFNSAKDNFGWAIDLGILFKLWRSNEIAIIAISDMELTARTNNDIYFNPKGGFWEEGILYSIRKLNLDWQIGYLHRCRHDIDNGDTNEFNGQPAERTLIYGSLTTRWLYHRISLDPRPNVDFGTGDESQRPPRRLVIYPWISADLYVFKEDYRQPGAALGIQPDYHNALFSLGAGTLFNIIPIGAGGAYFRGSVNLTAFGSAGSYFHSFSHIEKVTADVHTELGYAVEGPAARFQLYTGWERLGDDASASPPESSKFILIGLRLSGIDMVL